MKSISMAADLPTTAIRELIIEQLPMRYPKVEQIARRLGVPVRTLQRRLERAGLTYSGLVEETRFSLARHLLAQPDAHVAEVAKLLGYRDPSSFSRAFRRWTGDPPRAYCRPATSSKPIPGG